MEKKKVENITISRAVFLAMAEDLKGDLENAVDQMIGLVLEAVEETEMEAKKSASSPTGEDEGLACSARHERSQRSQVICGYIAAVAQSGIRIGDTWYEINDRTQIQCELVKGEYIKVYFFKGEYKVFANAIYSADASSQEAA